MTMKGDPGLRLEHRGKLVKTSLNRDAPINTLGAFVAIAVRSHERQNMLLLIARGTSVILPVASRYFRGTLMTPDR